ncbi:MAG: serine/threonine protein kinase [Cellvibrionaceae bacterium]|nr:serine/threonine protein kinase [Cellvibrionaceae bacterium]
MDAFSTRSPEKYSREQNNPAEACSSPADKTELGVKSLMPIASGDSTVVKASDITQISTQKQSAIYDLASGTDDKTQFKASDERIHMPSPGKVTAVDVEEATRVKLLDYNDDTEGDEVDQGFIINDRFVLEQEIGRGGMGVVYKARDLRKEEMHDESPMVALKLLNVELRDRHEALVALQRETVKSQTLAHPNIVTVYDFDRDGDLVYMSMEYLDGQTLEDLIQSGYSQRLPIEKVMALIEHMARALAYAHKKGFAHADLKPGNVFLTRNHIVKVLDFGIAQAIRGAHGHTPAYDTYYESMTLSAVTPNYASPEVLEENAPTPTDDMYALGCIAYALLTGRHPFRDAKGNKITSLDAMKHGLSVKKIPNLSPRYMAAILRCLQFQRDDRFQNAGEFLDAIKSPAKIKRWVLAVIAGSLCALLISWWVLLQQSTLTMVVDDLPDDMSVLASMIKTGDELFELGDIDQSHKLYAQAWDGSFDQAHISRKDQLALKVVIDRRVDSIIDYLINESQVDRNDEFRLLQLQIALEFLKRGDLGNKDDDIEAALLSLSGKLHALKKQP